MNEYNKIKIELKVVMTQSVSKSINKYNNLGGAQDLSAHLPKHNISSKAGNLILLKSKENSTLDFTFKYTSEEQLARAVKHVRRRRQQIQDENKWRFFNEKRLLEEEIQNQNQFLGNNSDSDERASHLSNLVINKDKIIGENANTIDSEGNYFNFKIVDEGEENVCKCTVSNSNTTNFNYEHVQLDNPLVSEELNLSRENQGNILHKPQKQSPYETQDSKHKDIFVRNANLGNSKFRRKCQVPGPLSISILKKMEDLVTYINKIGTVLSTNQNEFIDSDVAERNLKRLTEFTNLFARNYLYRIQRQKKEAKKIFFDGSLLPQDKLATMYQTAVQALQELLKNSLVQVYERYLLKTCIYKRCIQQLEQIVDFITFLISLTERVTKGDNFLHKQELVIGCTKLKSLLAEYARGNANISLNSVKTKKPFNKPNKEKQKKQDKLSMYASNQPKPFWKKTSAKLANAKFGPPSDRKNFENLKKGKETNVPRLNKKKSKEQIAKDKVSFEEVDSIDNCRQENNFENKVKFEKRFRHETRAIPEEEVVTMMEILKPQMNYESDEDESDKFISAANFGNDSVKISPIASETLEQNLSEEKLTSGVESSEKQEPTSQGKINSKASWPKNIQMVSIKADDDKNLNLPVQSISLNESKNPVHQLIVSDADKKIALGFKALVDSASPYDGSKPWDIVSRISDEVVFDVLENVCQSLEIDDVIQKLYDLEFK